MRSDLIRTEKETLSEVAYRYLKEQIISGVIREGDVITENNIGRALGMSRTPVKKALTQLESENYVRCLDGIGTVVVGLSLSDLRDIYDVRISMELLALKTSIHNIRPAEIAELRGDFQRELEAYRRAGGISDQRIAEAYCQIHSQHNTKSNRTHSEPLCNWKKNWCKYNGRRYIVNEHSDQEQQNIDHQKHQNPIITQTCNHSRDFQRNLLHCEQSGKGSREPHHKCSGPIDYNCIPDGLISPRKVQFLINENTDHKRIHH